MWLFVFHCWLLDDGGGAAVVVVVVVVVSILFCQPQQQGCCCFTMVIPNWFTAVVDKAVGYNQAVVDNAVLQQWLYPTGFGQHQNIEITMSF